MSCERLVCANCAGPVVEGRCPVCRAARAELHDHRHGVALTPQLVASLIALATVLLLLAAHAHG